MQQGTGGSTIKDVKAISGQPESVSSTAVKGFKVKSYSYLTLLFWCNSVIKRLSLRQFRVLNGTGAAISYRLKHLIVWKTAVLTVLSLMLMVNLTDWVKMWFWVRKMSPQFTSLELKLRMLVQVPVFRLLMISWYLKRKLI